MIIALLSIGGSFANFYLLTNQKYNSSLGFVMQLVLFIVAILAAIMYSGRKSRPSYTTWGVRFFTFRFAIIVLGIIGNLVMLLLTYMDMKGLQQWF